MKVKPLVWTPGPIGHYSRNINFDIAITPFGEYKAWYSTQTHPECSLWVPQRAEYSQHNTLNEAKEAAYQHLCKCIFEATEE